MEPIEIAESKKIGNPTKTFLVCSTLFLFVVVGCLGWFVVVPAIKENAPMRDDFSTREYDWGTDSKNESRHIEYEDGGLRVIKFKPDSLAYTLPKQKDMIDFHAEVNARIENADSASMFGFVCGYIDNRTFYFLGISNDGYYEIAVYANEYEMLASGQNADIPINSPVYKLGADCKKESLTLYVNDLQIAKVNTVNVPAGRFGLYVYNSGQTTSTSVLFDDFNLKKMKK
jgi:hypothetical protein